MVSFVRDLLVGTRDLVFAPVCVACDGPHRPSAAFRMVCAGCWARARALPHPRCDRCWTPLASSPFGDPPSCRLCPTLRPAVRMVRSPYLHDGPVRAMIHSLKYRGWHALAAEMARRMADVHHGEPQRDEVDLIVPVPLSRVRARQRGYNQAAMLAASLGSLTALPIAPEGLRRERSSGSQTTLHPAERRANVSGAFRVGEHAADVVARHVLLVDDVWTTGATALACADTLLDAGARAVSVMTFARAIPDLEERGRRASRALDSHP